MSDHAFPIKQADGVTIENADTSKVTVGGVDVLRPRTGLADPIDPAAITTVKNTAPAATDYGAVVRPLTATDGTHSAPTMDDPTRPGFVKVTDGVHTQPAMDDPTRPGFVTVTDLGTHADAALTDATNVTAAATLMAFVKGLIKIFADVWDNVAHVLRVTVTDLGTHADAAVTDATLNTSGSTAIALVKGLVKILADVWDTARHGFRVTIAADDSAPIANPLPVQNGDGTHSTPAGDDKTRAIIIKSAQGSKTGSVATIGTAAAQLLAANASRISAMIVNNGTVPIYLGNSNAVTTTNGIPLAAGASLSDTVTTDAWWAISGTAGQDVRAVEIA